MPSLLQIANTWYAVTAVVYTIFIPQENGLFGRAMAYFGLMTEVKCRTSFTLFLKMTVSSFAAFWVWSGCEDRRGACTSSSPAPSKHALWHTRGIYMLQTIADPVHNPGCGGGIMGSLNVAVLRCRVTTAVLVVMT